MNNSLKIFYKKVNKLENKTVEEVVWDYAYILTSRLGSGGLLEYISMITSEGQVQNWVNMGGGF